MESLRVALVQSRFRISTLAKCSSAKAFKSLPEILERLPGDGSFVRQRLSFVFGGRLVGRVGLPCRNCAYLLLCTRDGALCFCDSSFEQSLEVLSFLNWRQSDDLKAARVLSYEMSGCGCCQPTLASAI